MTGRNRNKVQKVLISAFSIEFNAGSEPGVGWAFLEMYHKLGFEVSVLTKDRGTNLNDSLAKAAPLNTKFIFIGHNKLIQKALFSKQFPFKSQIDSLMWNLKVSTRASSLESFSIIHHVTYAGDWNYTWLLCARNTIKIFGPVGGAQKIHKVFISRMKLSYRVQNMIRDLITGFGRYLNRFLMNKDRGFIVLVLNDASGDFFRKNRKAEVRNFSPIVLPCLHFTNSISELPHSKMFNELLADGRGYYIGAGRLIPLKQWDIAIQALATTYVDSRLILVGDGPERSNLELLTRKLGMQERVIFLGKLERDVVISLLIGARAAVFPSSRDSHSWFLAEALHWGVPIIAFKTPGNESVIPKAHREPDELLIEITSNPIEDMARALCNPKKHELRGSFCICRKTDDLREILR